MGFSYFAFVFDYVNFIDVIKPASIALWNHDFGPIQKTAHEIALRHPEIENLIRRCFGYSFEDLGHEAERWDDNEGGPVDFWVRLILSAFLRKLDNKPWGNNLFSQTLQEQGETKATIHAVRVGKPMYMLLYPNLDETSERALPEWIIISGGWLAPSDMVSLRPKIAQAIGQLTSRNIESPSEELRLAIQRSTSLIEIFDEAVRLNQFLYRDIEF